MFSSLTSSAVSLDIYVYLHKLLLSLVKNFVVVVVPLKIFCLDIPVPIWGHLRLTYTIRPKRDSTNRLNMSYSNTKPQFLKVQINVEWDIYRGADKSLARPGRKQARKHVKNARYFNNETRAVIKFFSPCKARRRRKFTQFWKKH